MTRTLGLGEGFYGTTQSLMAVGSILACAGLRGAGAPGVDAGAGPALDRPGGGEHAGLLGAGRTGRRRSAVAWSSGVIYMTATLIQLDLAARACPPEAAGSVFAILMALENLAAATSTGLGGWCYERGVGLWGPDRPRSASWSWSARPPPRRAGCSCRSSGGPSPGRARPSGGRRARGDAGSKMVDDSWVTADLRPSGPRSSMMVDPGDSPITAGPAGRRGPRRATGSGRSPARPGTSGRRGPAGPGPATRRRGG